ncbi:hypothetical protein [Candidatus Ichthyocystis sparus]|uniref:hypothetical protein n=1 Tax=Candidatus Ichthyocystis sparus TaxID=1561004 RepID=UPI000B863512|nr:hypothetical protein [Candidatus Ichthyocystis sparus]
MYNQGDGLVEHSHMVDGVCVTTRDEGSVEDSSGGQNTSGATKTAGSGSGAASTSSAAAPSSSAPAAASSAAAAASSAAAAPSSPPPALVVLMKREFGADWSIRFGNGFTDGVLGTPGDPSDDDVSGRFGELEEFLLSQGGGSFIALLAAVLLLLAKSSGNEAAREREVKMRDLLSSLKENLSAAQSLGEGASSALMAGVVSGIVGIVGAGFGMAGSFYASRLKAQSGDVATELESLGNPEATDLMRVDMPGGNGNDDMQTMDAAQTLQAQKADLVTRMTDLDNKATKTTTISEGVGRISASAGAMGSTVSTVSLTKAQSDQSHSQAIATEEAQSFGLDDDWQKSLSQLRDMILNVMGDAVRSMAQANSSAFRS